jgi:hypothetical protein
MPKPVDQPVIKLDDADNNTLHAVWSRTGNLIVSVAARGQFGSSWAGQVVLTSEQTARLQSFLAEGPRS